MSLTFLSQPLIGNVSVGAIQTSLPFPNTVVIMNINGSIVRMILENAVSRLNSNGTTVGQPGTGRFLQVAGVRVTINPRYPVGSRILSVSVLQ
jgi:5'-nucleotidase / UDP-sugar diphosphatase